MTRRHAACSGKTCLQLSARRSLAWLRSNLFTQIKGLPLLQRSTRAVYWRRLRSGVLNAGADGRCESLGPCLVGGTSVLGTGWRTGRIVVGPNECWKLTVARQGPPRRELMESTGPDRLPAERWCGGPASASTSGFNLGIAEVAVDARMSCTRVTLRLWPVMGGRGPDRRRGTVRGDVPAGVPRCLALLPAPVACSCVRTASRSKASMLSEGHSASTQESSR